MYHNSIIFRVFSSLSLKLFLFMVMKYRKNWYPDFDPERDNYNMHILDATNDFF